MQYRTLGSTGISVSVVGVGTWQFGGEWGHDFTPGEVDAILGTAREEGLNLIDTAECYGDHLSESLIGGRLRHERDQWVLATKFGHSFHHFMDRTRHWTGEAMRGQLEASLKALQTDYVDLLQFHSPTDEEFLNEELWRELEKVKQEGLVRHVGLSVSNNGNVMQVERSPEAHCETLQVVYNRLDRVPEEEVLPAAQRLNIGVLARVPLASGFLGGRHKPGAQFPPNDWRSTMDREKREALLAEAQRVHREEVPSGASLAEWALVWPLRHGAVTAVIPGCRTAEQVRDNARAVRLLG